MAKQLIQSTHTRIKRLAYYQIAGGILGVLVLIFALFQMETLDLQVIGVFTMASVFFSFSIYCGLLLTKPNHLLGLRLSKINQLVQVFSFNLFGLALKYISGICLGFFLKDNSEFFIGFNFSLSTFEILLKSSPEEISVGVNLLAVYLIYHIISIESDLEQIANYLKN
ncbi:MAG: hypothetical protein KA188_09910 [Leadbetterella sp.]|nr:hypothetical protein [Leadbetterella sp.]